MWDHDFKDEVIELLWVCKHICILRIKLVLTALRNAANANQFRRLWIMLHR
jgi:hypothetical protein